MDPHTNIAEQRTIALHMQAMQDRWDATGEPMNEDEQTEFIDDAGRLAELVLALDAWRKSGGFDPYGN